ncbi:MAG: hypothetical protein AMXMBFR4_19450 [Candidatus Hydrogenedentota bacterium]
MERRAQSSRASTVPAAGGPTIGMHSSPLYRAWESYGYPYPLSNPGGAPTWRMRGMESEITLEGWGRSLAANRITQPKAQIN